MLFGFEILVKFDGKLEFVKIHGRCIFACYISYYKPPLATKAVAASSRGAPGGFGACDGAVEAQPIPKTFGINLDPPNVPPTAPNTIYSALQRQPTSIWTHPTIPNWRKMH